MTAAGAKRCLQQAAESRIVFDQNQPPGATPASISDWVTGPVPGPSSTMRPCGGEPVAAAIARASARPDGATAPVNRGAAMRVLRKRALSASPGRRVLSSA